MISSSSPVILKEQAIAPPPSVICQALTFQVQNHTFALPLGAIVRIVQGRSVLSSQGESAQFLADLQMQLFEGEPLPILDLRLLLVESANTFHLPAATGAIAAKSHLFLMVVRLSAHQYCGLLVDQLPKIQPLSLTQCRRLPDFYRHKIANLANHAIVQESEAETNSSILFLLDLQSLQSRFLAQNPMISAEQS